MCLKVLYDIVPPWWRLDSWKHGEKKAWCTREELCNVDGPALNLTASNYTQLDANSTSTSVHITLQSFTQSLSADTVHWLWAALRCKSEEISPSSSPKQGAVVHSHLVWTGTEWRWGDHSFIAFSVSAPPTSSDLVRLFLLFLKPLVHFTGTSKGGWVQSLQLVCTPGSWIFVSARLHKAFCWPWNLGCSFFVAAQHSR